MQDFITSFGFIILDGKTFMKKEDAIQYLMLEYNANKEIALEYISTLKKAK